MLKKRKWLTILLSIICLMLFTIGLVSCGDREEDPPSSEPTATYTLTYVGGEGATGNAPGAKKYDVGETVVLADNTFTKSGYMFVGWSDGASTYAQGASFVMPDRDVTLTAQWEIDTRDTLSVNFDTLGGNELEALTVPKGSTLSFSKLPSAKKEGYIFDRWYLDNALTEEYVPDTHTFEENTTLYASYTEGVEESFTYYDIEESTLVNQSTTVKIKVIANGISLSSSNLGDYITLTNNFPVKETPTLTITNVGNGEYELTATPSWPEGGSFSLEAKEPIVFSVTQEINGDTITVKVAKLLLALEAEEKAVVEEQKNIITVERSDYFGIDDKTIYLKQSFAFEANIAKGTVMKVMLDNDYQYYKAGDSFTTTIGGVAAVGIYLEAPSINEVYENLQLYHTEDVDVESQFDAIDTEAVKREFAENEGFKQYQNLTTLAVADYVQRNSITTLGGVKLLNGTSVMNSKSVTAAPMAYVDVSKTLLEVTNVYENGEEWFYIYGSWRIVLDDGTYAEVSISLKTSVTIWLMARGDADIDLDWPWEDFIDVDIWFEIAATVRSQVKFNFDIVLVHNGERSDIRAEMESSTMLDPDTFMENYKRNIGLDNDDVTLIDIELFNLPINVLNILTIDIPVGFDVSISVNGAFAIEANYYSARTYGLRGSTDNGFDSYESSLATMKETTAYYNGTFGVKVGFYVGLDVSVLHLNVLGSVGVEASFGMYYDFYGYGYSYYHYIQSGDQELEWTKKVGGSYNELGLYIELSLYAESKLFRVKAETDLFEVKIPLIEGGNQYIAVDFSDRAKEVLTEGIVIDEYGTNLNAYELFYIEFMDMKTGDSVEMYAREDTIILGTGRFLVDDKGNLTLEEGLEDEGLVYSSELLIRYIGNMYGMVEIFVPVHFVPSEFDEDLAGTTYTVTFNINGEAYKSYEVPYGHTVLSGSKEAWELYNFSDEEWYAANPDVAQVVWINDMITRPITEDTVFEATLIPTTVHVEFIYNYLDAEGNVQAVLESEVLEAGDMLYDALDGLSHTVGDINENYTFIGWSVANKKVTHEDDGLQIRAEYQQPKVIITVKIDSLYNNEGVLLYEGRIHSTQITVGDTIPLSFLNAFNPVYTGYTPYYKNAYPSGAIFEDTTIEIGWNAGQTFMVTVYDAAGGVLAQRTVGFEDNASDIMKEAAVTSYNPVYVGDPRYTGEFTGWSNVWYLSKVVGNVDVTPMFDLDMQYFNITFDPNGGEFPYYIPAETDGTLSESWRYGSESGPYLSYLIPTKASTDTENYTFNGWYYLDDNGNKVSGIQPATEDRTYYAEWVKSDREWQITVYANTLADGAFEDGTTEYTITGSYAEIDAKIKAIEGGDYTGIQMPIPTDTMTEFNSWVVYRFEDSHYELHPRYKGVIASATLTYNVGKGSLYDGRTGSFTQEYSVDTQSSNFTYVTLVAPNENIEVLDQVTYNTEYAAYVEGGYYYTFKEWSYPEGSEVYFPSDSHLQIKVPVDTSVTVTAVYEAHPLTYEISFYVADAQAIDPEDIDAPDDVVDTLHNGWIMRKYYGTRLTEADLPTAKKTIANDRYGESFWEYVFEGWYCVETGAKGVEMVVEANRTYTAIFSKQLRTVEVTFDAGEHGYFASTGTRYKTYSVNAGTELKNIGAEIPLRDETYVFMAWDHYEGVVFSRNATVNAYYYNVVRDCEEGLENFAKVTLDAGANAVFEHTGERYATAWLEIGSTYDECVEALSWLQIEKDGYLHSVTWDIDKNIVITTEMHKNAVIGVASLTKLDLVKITVYSGNSANFGDGEKYITYWLEIGETIELDSWYLNQYVYMDDTGAEVDVIWDVESSLTVTEDTHGLVISAIDYQPITA